MSVNDDIILNLIKKDARINIFNDKKELLPRSNQVWELIRDKLNLEVQCITIFLKFKRNRDGILDRARAINTVFPSVNNNNDNVDENIDVLQSSESTVNTTCLPINNFGDTAFVSVSNNDDKVDENIDVILGHKSSTVNTSCLSLNIDDTSNETKDKVDENIDVIHSHKSTVNTSFLPLNVDDTFNETKDASNLDNLKREMKERVTETKNKLNLGMVKLAIFL